MLKKKTVKLRMRLPRIQTTLGILRHLLVIRQSGQGPILKMVLQKHTLKVIKLVFTLMWWGGPFLGTCLLKLFES